MSFVLAIDQGTTSTRAIVYDDSGRVVGCASRELPQHFPHPGWVEHDPEEIWQTVVQSVPEAIARANLDPCRLAAIGITNQRETCLLWNRATGVPLGRALVWQDRRTADFCRDRLADESWIRQRTGLVLDPYFSGTKLHWLFDRAPDLRSRAERRELACGTVDSFLIHRLTGGAVHATDRTNASRTLLLDLATAAWDDELCRYFGVPAAALPEVRPSAGDFGVTRGLDFLPDGVPIRGVAGDQQAALVGQQAFHAGDAKCTYGTGAFFLLHVGDKQLSSTHRLLTALAASADSSLQFALEGSVFIAGAAVQWLRDRLHLLQSASDVEELAAQSDPDEPILFVPGLVGLGAPHWLPQARGVLFGLTRATSSAEFARAALEGVAFQVADLVDAAAADSGSPLAHLRVDGGMSRNAWFLQCQADLLGIPVLQAPESETTALGAAFLAGLAAGVWPDVASLKRTTRAARRFDPALTPDERQKRRDRWHRAVQAVRGFYSAEPSSA